jgi:predicted nucleic acid-binding protein
VAKRHFLDTNVLVYAFDADARKRAIARGLIERALDTHDGVISSQVVQEFLNVATRKFARPMSNDEAVRYFDQVLEPLCAVWPDAELLRHALSLRARFQFGLYDSLIVAAALRAGCTTLYSEDLQRGQRIDSVTVVDPFEE